MTVLGGVYVGAPSPSPPLRFSEKEAGSRAASFQGSAAACVVEALSEARVELTRARAVGGVEGGARTPGTAWDRRPRGAAPSEGGACRRSHSRSLTSQRQARGRQ
eukprot:2879608-Rhodomonas_salina.1